MIEKKFGGFSEEQIKSIAKQLGHTGDVGTFNDFLTKNPEKASQFFNFSSKTKNMAEGGPVTGGELVSEEDKKKSSAMITPPPIDMPDNVLGKTDVFKTQVKDNQLVNKNAGNAGDTKDIKAEQVDKPASAKTPEELKANTYDPKKVTNQVGNALDDMYKVKGTLSEDAQVKAATALPSANATVQGQLEKLYADFEDGKTPAWAAGAMRKAEAIMGARGLGASSMAGGAITQAAMESALDIAVQDASTYSQFEMKNLDNRQQAALVNAQSFLQMDMKNLDIASERALFKTQSMIQSLFSDQAAENASKQFNASSKNQTDQFFSQLKSQVQQFNASQRNAMKQYNNEQENAVKMFNSQQKNQRDEFNANNRLIIDQSNAEWRRSISTINNQNQNEANRLDSQAMTGLTTSAYNNYWQTERDIMAFAFTAAENSTQRAHEVVLAKMGNDTAKDIQSSENRGALGAAAGGLVAEVLKDWIL